MAHKTKRQKQLATQKRSVLPQKTSKIDPVSFKRAQPDDSRNILLDQVKADLKKTIFLSLILFVLEFAIFYASVKGVSI
ncbi:MAG: hypothetical protein ACMG6E_00425 [Candidatus Roizmanbacteria bacterium]